MHFRIESMNTIVAGATNIHTALLFGFSIMFAKMGTAVQLLWNQVMKCKIRMPFATWAGSQFLLHVTIPQSFY